MSDIQEASATEADEVEVLETIADDEAAEQLAEEVAEEVRDEAEDEVDPEDVVDELEDREREELPVEDADPEDRDDEIETLLELAEGLAERETELDMLVEAGLLIELETEMEAAIDDDEEGAVMVPLTFLGSEKPSVSPDDRYSATLFHCPQFWALFPGQGLEQY
jgi:hypothetical protein